MPQSALLRRQAGQAGRRSGRRPALLRRPLGHAPVGCVAILRLAYHLLKTHEDDQPQAPIVLDERRRAQIERCALALMDTFGHDVTLSPELKSRYQPTTPSNQPPNAHFQTSRPFPATLPIHP